MSSGKRDPAFTGLEAAVIMIAFVVVAAVFAYSVLSMGFFATQKVQEVTFAGVKQSVSTAITDGTIRGEYEPATGLTSLTFSISAPEAGEAIALADMVYYYSRNNDAGKTVPLEHVTPHEGFIQPGKRTRVTINLTAAGLAGPMAGGTFSLEIKPPIGASTLIQKKLDSSYIGGYL